MAQPMTHLGQPRSVRVIGAIALRTAVGVLLLAMLMVLGETWAPQVVDPVLLRLGL